MLMTSLGIYTETEKLDGIRRANAKRKITEDLDPKKKKEVLKKKSSTQVTPVTLPQNQCLPSGMPSLQNIRQDAFMRQVDDERLRDLAQNENAGKRLNLLGVALWRSWF